MNVTVEIPEDRAPLFQKHAEALGLTLEGWLLELAEKNAPVVREGVRTSKLSEVLAKVRGLADDLDFIRDASPGRDVIL